MSNFKRKLTGIFGSDRTSSAVVTALVIATVLILNAVLFALVETFGWYAYSADKTDYSLSGSADLLFADAIADGKKVKISFCMPESDVASHSTGSDVYQTAKKFAERYAGFIELDYINIITKQNKDGELVNLSKYKTDKYGNETPIYKTSIIFECGGEYRVLTDTYTSTGFAPFFTLNSSRAITSYNGEEVMAAMVLWVLNGEHKHAYFTQYHGETVDTAFSNLLSCAGYYVDVIDLRKSEVPDDADLVIISNPRSDFEAAREGSGIRAEIDRLKTYAERGGNLYVALDPYVKKLSVLEGFIAEYGITLSATVTDGGTSVRNIVKDTYNAITADGFTLVMNYADGSLAETVEETVRKYSDGDVIVREAAALELTGNARPLLEASSASVLEADGSTVSRAGSYCVAAYSELTSESGGVSKIFVIPSVYVAVSDALVSRGYSNKDFMYSLFENLYGAEGMPYGCKAILYSTSTLENLKMGTARIYTAVFMLIPAAIAVTGAAVIIKRKNR